MAFAHNLQALIVARFNFDSHISSHSRLTGENPASSLLSFSERIERPWISIKRGRRKGLGATFSASPGSITRRVYDDTSPARGLQTRMPLPY